ncbi:GntR family transcriptional regulator [Stella sp.]|uniref:GntR family transcriptional regulator n=1 Tax=Stella sp. TaxID=2912054 RepID=UPI0035B16EAE
MTTSERAKRIRRPTGKSALQTELVRQILGAIVEDGVAVGGAIRELPLAHRFGVSRTPVRAALRLLQEQGWLAFDPGRGFSLVRAVPAEALHAAVSGSAVDDLHRAILDDRARGLLPIEVSEASLMPRYGASRGTVRRALMRLADDGLARRQRGHGWRFAEALDTPDAVVESYRFRIVVECAALSEPTFRPDPATLVRLRDQHLAILENVEKLDPAVWLATNDAFHEAVAVWSHNRFLLEAVRRQNALRRFVERSAFQRLSPARFVQSSREHLAILEAIEKDDRTWAASLLERHLALAARSYTDRQARDAAAAEAAAGQPVSRAGRSASPARVEPR